VKYQGPGQPIYINYPCSIKRHIVDYVLAKYRAAGWIVEEFDDQRDGREIKFTP
jgi:hypothetical protein